MRVLPTRLDPFTHQYLFVSPHPQPCHPIIPYICRNYTMTRELGIAMYCFYKNDHSIVIYHIFLEAIRAHMCLVCPNNPTVCQCITNCLNKIQIQNTNTYNYLSNEYRFGFTNIRKRKGKIKS